MKYLNISTLVDLEEKTTVDDFDRKIKEHSFVKDYKVVDDVFYEDKKVKLGLDEHEIEFKLDLAGDVVPVLMYLQLSADGINVKTVEVFTGINSFIIISEYEKQLLEILDESIEHVVDIEMNIVGNSNTTQ